MLYMFMFCLLTRTFCGVGCWKEYGCVLCCAGERYVVVDDCEQATVPRPSAVFLELRIAGQSQRCGFRVELPRRRSEKKFNMCPSVYKGLKPPSGPKFLYCSTKVILTSRNAFKKKITAVLLCTSGRSYLSLNIVCPSCAALADCNDRHCSLQLVKIGRK